MRNYNSCKNCVLNHVNVLIVEEGYSSKSRHIDDILMADAHITCVAVAKGMMGRLAALCLSQSECQWLFEQ